MRISEVARKHATMNDWSAGQLLEHLLIFLDAYIVGVENEDLALQLDSELQQVGRGPEVGDLVKTGGGLFIITEVPTLHDVTLVHAMKDDIYVRHADIAGALLDRVYPTGAARWVT